MQHHHLFIEKDLVASGPSITLDVCIGESMPQELVIEHLSQCTPIVGEDVMGPQHLEVG